MPVIGILESGSTASLTSLSAEFHAGLKETGFVEGQNVAIEYRRAEAQYDGLPAFAAELVGRQVTCDRRERRSRLTPCGPSGNQDNSIAFLKGTDPVQTRIVASLSQPGGNITGLRHSAAKYCQSKRECSMSWCRRQGPSPCCSIRKIRSPER
jgi:putative ABC transport system substrate-binding protein